MIKLVSNTDRLLEAGDMAWAPTSAYYSKKIDANNQASALVEKLEGKHTIATKRVTLITLCARSHMRASKRKVNAHRD